ncbi:benzoate/H(+) symporter BenE family transporter [Halopseudomonas pachastrellae]|nr:benzoate/H(+) symporter BenE family transporter [Halopseudomonas pachastrellae]
MPARTPDRTPSQRFRASAWGGFFYLLTGLFGATVASLFAAFRRRWSWRSPGWRCSVLSRNALATALHDESQREAAFLTFLVTASGLALWGIGSAFWGLLLGLLVLRLPPSRVRSRRRMIWPGSIDRVTGSPTAGTTDLPAGSG